MFWKFKREAETIFVDSNSPDFQIEGSVNVILSPSLYWVKRVSLPVKSLREVKPLLESLFEDILPEGSYSYSASTFGEEYLLFAYKDRELLELLSKKGIAASKINGVYFAQNEFLDLDEPKKIDENEALVVKDGMVILLPTKFTHVTNTLHVKDRKLSKYRIKLKQFGNILNEKSLYTITVLFFILSLIVGAQYIMTMQKIEKLQSERDGLFSRYALKPTMMQNRALLKGYEKSYKREMELRRVVALFLSMRLKKNHKITSISYKNREMKVALSGLKRGSDTYIISYLRSHGVKFRAKYKNNIWYVEVKI